MIEAFWIPLLPPYLIGLVLSFLVEVMLTPRPVAPWRRPLAAVGVHVGVWTLAFALELMLFRRPYFAVANVLAIELVIVLVSNAKYQALREPFVYPDFEYFMDAIRHPRLYLPFFGVGRALAAGGGYGVVLWVGLTMEDSVTAGAGMWLVSFVDLTQEHIFDPTAPVMLFFSHALIIGVFGIMLALFAGKHIKVSLNAEEDLKRVGLMASLWVYRRMERKPTTLMQEAGPFKIDQSETRRGPTADIVVLQSESFFDARRAYSIVNQNLLSNFDILKNESALQGVLTTAAWGANTVRTEFGFLSGMRTESLGVHRYNPYRKLAINGFPTIASYLRNHGYRTICVHPYHKSFYRRDMVYPKIGFDEFINLEHFKDAELDGAYVADSEVAKKVIELLSRNSVQPLYIHVITMENHGPLHWGKPPGQEISSLLNSPMPVGCEDLGVYLRHLRNADKMFGTIRAALLDRDKKATLCIYGDHVPIMPHVYRRLGSTDGTTDYLIWKTDRAAGKCEYPMRVEDLAMATLRIATEVDTQ